MKARFFVVAQRIGQRGFLSGQQIQKLSSEGMAVESHGMTHRNWVHLGAAELHRELVEARDIIQQVTGVPVTEAACPMGGYDRHSLRMLGECGYQRVYTSDGGIARADSWIQPRISIRRRDDLARVMAMCSVSSLNMGVLWRDIKIFLKSWR